MVEGGPGEVGAVRRMEPRRVDCVGRPGPKRLRQPHLHRRPPKAEHATGVVRASSVVRIRAGWLNLNGVSRTHDNPPQRRGVTYRSYAVGAG